jgi:hypothetical protein
MARGLGKSVPDAIGQAGGDRAGLAAAGPTAACASGGYGLTAREEDMAKPPQNLMRPRVPPQFSWAKVTRVLAIKEDAFGCAAVSLAIWLEGRDDPILVQPATPGYRQILTSLHERLLEIRPDWYEQMMQDWVPCYERELYRRDERA